MDRRQIIQAWKDPEYRARLTAEERSKLPDSPSGSSLTELSPEELGQIVGGIKEPIDIASTGCTGPVRQTCGIVLCDIKSVPVDA